jgi:hypothetical protein
LRVALLRSHCDGIQSLPSAGETDSGGCDLPQLADRRFSFGRARSEQLPHLPLRVWVDFTCARNGTTPVGWLVAIQPESPSQNWQRTCPGVQLGRSWVLRTGQNLVTDPKRQSITSQSKSESRHLNLKPPFQNRQTVGLYERLTPRVVGLFAFQGLCWQGVATRGCTSRSWSAIRARLTPTHLASSPWPISAPNSRHSHSLAPSGLWRSCERSIGRNPCTFCIPIVPRTTTATQTSAATTQCLVLVPWYSAIRFNYSEYIISRRETPGMFTALWGNPLLPPNLGTSFSFSRSLTANQSVNQ